MKDRLKYWYYRHIKYRKVKFKMKLSYPLNPGTTIILPSSAAIHIGKEWFIPKTEWTLHPFYID